MTFFLQGVYEVAQEATATARKIIQLRERHRTLVATQFPRSSGIATKFLEHLFARPIVTIKGVAEVTGQTFSNASQLVIKFQACGILSQLARQKRNRRFMYTDYLAIVAGDELAPELARRNPSAAGDQQRTMPEA